LTPPSDDGPGVADSVGSDGVVTGEVGAEGVDAEGTMGEVGMSVSEAPGDAIFGTFGGHDAALSVGRLDGDVEGIRLDTPEGCDDGEAVLSLGDNVWPGNSMLVGSADPVGATKVGRSVSEAPGDAIFGTFGGHDAAPTLGRAVGIVEGFRLDTPESCDDGEAVLSLGDNVWPADSMLVGFDDAKIGREVGKSVSEAPGDAIFGTFGGHEAAPSLGRLDGVMEGLRSESPGSCEDGEAEPVLDSDVGNLDGVNSVGVTSDGFGVNTVGAGLGVDNERKLMEVTAAEPARMSLICLTFAMLIANSWYELSPNIGTSIAGSSNIPVPVSTVTMIDVGLSTSNNPISCTYSTTSGKSNTMIPPSPLLFGMVLSPLSAWTIRTFPKYSQFAPSMSGSPPSPIPGPGGLHRWLGLPRAGSP
jgi:hypothetical protein